MKLTGFICQSQASTAVCIPGDSKCVIVPRSYANDRTRLINPRHSSYHPSESRRFSLDHRRSSSILERTDRNSANTTHDLNSLISADRVFQVVVMKVSLHCQGCAGKVRKHISKMEGVTSFSIDLEKKKVTVMGHISPEQVLESVSKVKKAELWPISKQSI